MRLLLALLGALLFACVSFAMGGSGTPGDPYQITTCTDLQSMATGLSASYALMNDITCNGFDAGDGKGFLPIGNYSGAFTGTLDGQNHRITGLSISRNATDGSGDRIGLVGSASSASISNVILENASIVGYYSVGSLAGYMDFSTHISNCSTVAANVTCYSPICGGLLGWPMRSIITNSSATANVTIYNAGIAGIFAGEIGISNVSGCHAAGNATGGNYLGGFAGTTTGDSDNPSNIINSSTDVNITSSGVDSGGFIGDMYNTNLTGSNAKGSIITGGFAGGLVGHGLDCGNIADSYAAVDITGGGYNGGLVGLVSNCNIDNSSATGNLSCSGSYCGGFAGKLTGSVITRSSASGSVASSGGDYLGGFAGDAESSAGIDNSYATGTVSSSGNYCGGFVGMASSSIVNHSYSSGSVASSGGDYLGGFAGDAESSAGIDNSFAAGAVSGANAAGLVGRNDSTATISNSYWDVCRSGQSACTADGNIPGCTGINDSCDGYFYDSSHAPLSSWDFTNVWYAHAGAYPNFTLGTPPGPISISFAAPTPANGSVIYYQHAVINVTASENVSSCMLRTNASVDWPGLWTNVRHLGLYGGRFDYNASLGFGGYSSFNMMNRLSLSAGPEHTCYIRSNGNSVCYGNNAQGQSASYTGGDAVAVSSGESYTCYLFNNGSTNCYGMFPNPSWSYIPMPNYPGSDAVAISANSFHTCYLLRNGTSMCYGDNTCGGNSPCSGQSTNYTGGDAITLSAGKSHTCYLLSNGNSACYGESNCTGNTPCIGANGQSTNYTGGDAIAVSAGYYSTCYLLSNGNSTCYGWNYAGMANNYTGGDAVAVAVGAWQTCYLRSNGDSICYGYSLDGDTTPYTGGDAIAVSAGGWRNCYLLSSGDSVCYGWNGDNRSTNYTAADLKIPFTAADASLAMQVNNADANTNANYTLPALPDGDYRIYANCTTPANVSGVSETRVFTLSLLAAPLLINFTDPTPHNGTTVDYQGAVFNVTVTKNVSSCAIDINGNESPMQVHNADGRTTANYTLPALPDGNYTIYANCTDSNKSNVSEARTFALALSNFMHIYNVSVSYNGGNATITWNTNQDANSTVDYGTTTGLGNYSVDSTPVQLHRVVLTGLPEVVPYYYNVTSCTGGGLCNTSGPYVFSVPSFLLPVNFVPPTPANGSALTNPNVTINVTTNQNVTQCLLSLYTPDVLWTNVKHLGIYGGRFDYNASMGFNNYSSFNMLNRPSIAGAAYETCYLLNNGNSYCYGNDTYGYGLSVNYTGGDAISMATGQIHTCYLLSSGNSVCYGNNGYGQSVNYTGGDAIAVSATHFHTCYLLRSGNSACYGYNTYGQTTNYTGGDAIAVGTGYAHTCYLLSNGNSVCYGPIADGATVNYTGGDAIGLAVGMDHTCYLRSDGSSVCYGNNQFGQSIPYGGSDTIAISAGEMHTCYLRSNGNSVCHGRSGYGTAGYTGGDAIGVAAGFYHTCYLLRNGNSVCDGDNVFGQFTNYNGGDVRLPFQYPAYQMTVHNASNATTADYLPPLMFNGNYTFYANCTSPAHVSNVSETRTFSLMLFQPDAYEPDDSMGQANWIAINGTMQRHNFHSLSDFDYVMFNATAGYTYIIQAVTRNDSGVIDTEMYLLDSSGTALAYSDDISPANVSSRIMFRPAQNGTYYVEVDEVHGVPGGVYDLLVQQHGILTASIVNVTRTALGLNSSFNITTTVRCTGGPCGNVTANLDPAPAAIRSSEEPKQSLSELAENGSIPVIVKLKDASPSGGQKGGKSIAQAMAQSQAAVLSTLSAGEFTPGYRYTIINGFSGSVSSAGLEKLLADPAVESVSYDREEHIALDVSVPFIGAPSVWNITVNGIYMNGTGQTVCMLDTGINYSHPDFGGYGTFPNAKIIGGYDYVNNDSDPMDDNGHGSHVSGIIASMDATYRGVAPGADIVMVKVCDSTGSCPDSAMLAGIQWCIDNASLFNISAISMSIGGEAYEDGWDCDSEEAAMAAAINAAVAHNITFMVSSGNGVHNDGYGLGYMNPGGLTAPACVKNAVSVGAAVDSSDGLAYFGNRNNQLDLLAPGWSITSTSYDTGGHTSMMGTSMSAPHVAGLTVLMNQYYLAKYNRRPTPHELELVMKHDGRPDMDYTGRNPLTYPRIDSLPSVLDLGILSTNSSARPFYTTASNPAADPCLANMSNGTSCNSTWRVVPTGDSGNYTFYTIYETSYDIFYTDSRNITLSANAPNVTLNAPADGNVSTSSNVALSFTVTHDLETTLPCRIYINGTLNATVNATNGTRYDFNRTYGDSDYAWYVNCSDSAGNTGVSANRTFIVDAVAPAITIISPVNNTLYTNATIRVNISVVEAHPDTTWFFNGTANETYTSSVLRTFSEGNHNLAVWSNDTAGHLSTAFVNFTVDTISPTIDFVAPTTNSSASLLVNYILVNVSANDTMLANMTIRLYNSSGALRNSTTTSSASNLFANFSGLPDGTYYFNATAYDTATHSNSTATWNVTLDTVPPAITIISPVNNTLYGNSTIRVNISVVEAHPVSTWFFNGTANETYTSSVLRNFSEGNHQLTVWSNDTAGHLSTAFVNFTVDTQPPVVTLNSPANASIFNVSSVTFNFTALDNLATPLNCSLYLDGVLNRTNSPVPNGTATVFMVSGLESRNHTWSVRCSDAASNTNTSETRNFFVDTIMPVVTLNSPANGSATNLTTLAFGFSAVDSAVATLNCSLYLDGTLNTTNATTPTGTSITFNVTGIADGSHLWNVNCTDIANNTGASQTVTVVVDTAAPTVTLNTPANATFINTSSSVTFNFTATDALSQSMSCTLLIDDASRRTVTAQNNTPASIPIGVSNGNRTWRVDCTDAAGNEGISLTRILTMNSTSRPPVSEGHNAITPQLSVAVSSSCGGNVVTVTSGGRAVNHARVVLDGLAVYYANSSGIVSFTGCGRTVAVYASADGYSSADLDKELIDCAQCGQPVCINDSDCAADATCVQGSCSPVPCPCGRMANHRCTAYACCSNSDCAAGQCSDHSCVQPSLNCSSDAQCADNQQCTDGNCADIAACGRIANHSVVEQWECGSAPACPACGQDMSCENAKCLAAGISGPANVSVGQTAPISFTLGSVPCDGCEVQITDPGGRTFSGTTDANGRYSLPATMIGTYKVTLLRSGVPVKSLTLNSLAKQPPATTPPAPSGGLPLLPIAAAAVVVIAVGAGAAYLLRAPRSPKGMSK